MEEKEYRVKVEYISTTPWYDPQIKCRFLWWSYWDSIGNLYRERYMAEEKIDEHLEMLKNPKETKPFSPQS